MNRKICLFAAAFLMPLMFFGGQVCKAYASDKSFGIDEINWTEQDWNSIGMTNDDTVTTGIVIRSEASEESGVEGYLYRGGAVNILDRTDEWTRISSGGVTGYVRNEYIVRGTEAKGFAAKYGKEGIVAKWDDVKVFSKADAESAITGSLNLGTALTVLSEDGKWLTVQKGADSTGFVSEEDVTRMLLVDTAVPVETEEEEEKPEGGYENSYENGSDGESSPSESAEAMDSSSAEEDADDGSEPDSTSEFTEENPALTELKAEDNQEGYEEQSQEDSSFYGTDESYGGDDAASSEGTEDGSSSGELQLTTVSDDSYVQSMYEAYVEAQNAAMHPDSEEDAYAKADEAKRAYQAYLDAANGVSSSGTDAGSSEDYTEDSSSYDSGSSEESGSDSGSGSESGYSESSSSYDSGSTNASGYSDLDLLAGIIWCEAGNQPYEGMVAVGEVVMNRVASGAFPNTIEGVLSQPGQFTPYSSGGLQSALANGVNSSCYAAAQDALNGVSPVPGALYFNTASGTTKLGDHYFS